jgi:hypothetical protein
MGGGGTPATNAHIPDDANLFHWLLLASDSDLKGPPPPPRVRLLLIFLAATVIKNYLQQSVVLLDSWYQVQLHNVEQQINNQQVIIIEGWVSR